MRAGRLENKTSGIQAERLECKRAYEEEKRIREAGRGENYN